MSAIISVCVFCGSSSGADPAYREAAEKLGEAVAARGLRLVYGGGHVGLMGAVADAALAANGTVVGVITRALEAKEIAHTGLTELRVVDSMHERKATMADLADAFVMLPGGFGTWDEFMEVVTWSQLGIHHKPCGVLEVGTFFDSLRTFIDRATSDRFIRQEHRELVMMDDSPQRLLDRLVDWRPVASEKWVDRSDH